MLLAQPTPARHEAESHYPMNPMRTIITLTVLGPFAKDQNRNTRPRLHAPDMRRAMVLVRPNDPPAHLHGRLTDSVMRLGGGAVVQISNVIDAILLDLQLTDPRTNPHAGTHHRRHWTLKAAWDDPFADPYDRRAVRMHLVREPALKTQRQGPGPTHAPHPAITSLHRVGLS